MAEVLELKRKLAYLYKPDARAPRIVEVPTLRFLMVDGVEDVGGPGFSAAMRSLVGLAYQVKFAASKRLDLSYPVMPPEGLYRGADWDPLAPFAQARHVEWRLMTLLPDAVSREFVDEVREKVAAKKKDLPRLPDIRVQSFTEGTSVQVLHIGPHAAVGPTLDQMRIFAAEEGLEFSGARHEIYLGDPGRAAQEKLKTGLRCPVRPAH